MDCRHANRALFPGNKGDMHCNRQFEKPHTGKIKKGLLRRIIFQAGTIPRGRGKAQDASIPNEETTESGLGELFSKAKLSVQKAADSDYDCWWAHFAFGVMKRDEALKFVEIHKIISDILSND